MKNNREDADSRVKKKIITWRSYLITYIVTMLLAGVHIGIIIWPVFSTFNAFIQITVILIYWAIVAAAFTLLTGSQLKRQYDVPMRSLSAAAKKVAAGDFSVYVNPLHTPDNYNYIDAMAMDFNAMVQELGSIETLKNDFIANVSHEIKTPLSIIKNYATLLKNKNLSEDMREEYAETIVKAVNNLSSLVSNILRLNKLDNQEINLPADEYDLCRQLSECALGFESLWEQKNIVFNAEIEEKVIIKANSDMLEIVWNNLLSNAHKFTAPGGRVALTQTSDADRIRVSVSDSGIGMSSDTVKHIFEKFYQGDTSHSGDGNGLGLALAYRVIDKLGGTLAVTSQPGKGSTFTATLPINH
jgi:signal transduction histidine kinase